jgi:hypothetical protein
MTKLMIGAAASALVLFAADAASAQILHYGAVLKGPAGHGELSAVLDTDSGKLDCTVDYSGIAAAGADLTGDAGEVDLDVSPKDNPIESVVTLNKTQVAALGNGNYWFDLKGASGDIKGKVYRDDSRGG